MTSLFKLNVSKKNLKIIHSNIAADFDYIFLGDYTNIT